MKKRFIPATIAALALSFSAVAVPQAVAQEDDTLGGEVENGVEDNFEADFVLKPGETQSRNFSLITDAIDRSDLHARFDELDSVEFDLEGLTYDFEDTTRNLIADESTAEGNHVVEVTLDFGEGDVATGTLYITIDGSGPEITPIEDRTLWVDAEIEPIEVEVSDLSGVKQVEVDGLPDGLEYDAESREITGTPTGPTGVGVPAVVTVTATDVLEHSSTETFQLIVAADNTAPVIEAIEGNREWEVGTAIDPIEVVVTEENPYTVSVGELPEGLTYDAATGVISGTPTAVTEEAQTLTVNAVDAAGNEAQPVTFTYTVGPDETAPVITAPENQTVGVGSAIEPIEIVVSEDAEVTVTDLPAGLTYDAESGAITGTPTEVTEEAQTVTVDAVDAAGNEAEPVTFTITVTDEAEEPGSAIGSGEGSSADDINWGLVGLGGVLAAVIGVIAAIGGGFIQLPPAIANLIPFL